MQTKAQRRRNQARPDAAERAGNKNGGDKKNIQRLALKRRGEQQLQEKEDRNKGQRTRVDDPVM
jgi:hypothetical protein